MKRIISLLLIACSLCRPLAAQVPTDATSKDATSRPEFEQLVADYEKQEDAVNIEIKPQLLAARDQYQTDLEALAKKLDESKRAEEAKKLREEAKRFTARGINCEPLKTSPPAVRTPWTILLRVTAAATQSVALKRSSLRSKFEQGLTGLERTYRTKNDADGVALVRRARATVAIRRSLEAGAFATTEVLSKNADWWQDVAREGGYVVGFEVGKGGWFQFSVLGSMKPIFATIHGVRDGEERGKNGGERVLAKEGYAVGGLLVRFGDVVNMANVIFMRINPDGVSLNPQDAYFSGWLGGEGGGKPVELNPRGHLIVGVTGASSDIVDSLGLVFLK